MKKDIIKPNSLKQGDKIGIISPAGAISSPDQLTKTMNLIKDKGYIPVLGSNATKSYYHNGYNFAGTDKQRQDDLHWAFFSDDIKAVWATRGGYGSVRIRETMLDIIKNNKQNKWYMGYSDNTYLESMLLVHGNTKPIYGQNIINGYNSPDITYDKIFNILAGNIEDYEIPSHKLNDNANIKGMIIGGNASLIYSMLGTPEQYNFDEIILYIEDIGESHYSMDRLLNSIKLSLGDKIKAVLVGGMQLNGSDYDPISYDVVKDVFSSVPKMFGFPNGHITNNQPLIIGSQVSLEIKNTGTSKLKHIA